MRLPNWDTEGLISLPEDYEGIKIRYQKLLFRPKLFFDYPCIGIDPGQVNMGAAIINPGQADLFEFTLPSSKDPIERMTAATNAIQYILLRYPEIKAACLEGAAFMASQGQVPLAENRAAAAIALMQGRIRKVEIVPPGRIREAVFLYGRWRSQEVWPALPPNAGSALGCAFYMYKQYRKELLT